MSPTPRRVAVIGAGYAGMAAAVELTARSIPATVFEASRTLGGRARSVELEGHQLDNGQHILIGAYRETLHLMKQTGSDPDRLLKRIPLHLEYPGQLCLSAPHLPAPLHLAWALIAARGLNWREKIAAIRFMNDLKRNHFRLEDDKDRSVAALLDLHNQPQRLRDYLWEPLCVAALNTGAAHASAQVFLNVLRDSLASTRESSDLLLPVTDLSALFPEPAAAFVEQHGGSVRRQTAIRRIARTTCGFTLHDDHQPLGDFSEVIVAVAPYHLATLLDDLPELVALRASIAGLQYEPIVTCYLAYPPHIRLPAPMLGHAGGILQWLFDRGQLGGPQGLLAAIVSARGRHLELSGEELALRIHGEIRSIRADLPSPRWHRTITEKRATFSCTPALARPTTITPLAGLLLAGDYIACEYPGTIEAAVRSGTAAATAIK